EDPVDQHRRRLPCDRQHGPADEKVMRRLLPVVVLALLGLAPQEGPSADRLLDVLEKRHRETPDPSDVRLAATRLGFDRAKILDYVKGLSWEPYGGILRDASGTLLCGAGNSL